MVVTAATDAAPGAQAPLPLTPAQTEGPFFRIGAPRRESLLEPGMSGERLLLVGRVLTPEGHVVPGALLQFWMSDDQGNYDGAGYRLQGYTVTNERGGYQMEAIVPACYEPRQARHIHVKVQGVGRPLTTQLYFSDDEQRAKDRHFLPELEVQVDDAPEGGKRGTFDFVVGQYTEHDNVTPETLTARV
jgi:protocatechuate 3,4-dioxygenase beta subunit